MHHKNNILKTVIDEAIKLPMAMRNIAVNQLLIVREKQQDSLDGKEEEFNYANVPAQNQDCLRPESFWGAISKSTISFKNIQATGIGVFCLTLIVIVAIVYK